MSEVMFRSLAEAKGHFGPCALAIGNFDGVHIGHRKLIEETVALAKLRGVAAAVLTFDPHPAAVVAPERVPALICPLEERLRLIAAAGIERIFVLPFTHDVARLSAEEFVVKILVGTLETRAVLVGENFRFGYRQAGTPPVLEFLGFQYGFETSFLPPVKLGGEIVSSTAVRTELQRGKVVRAARLLGRYYSLAGSVISGRGIGTKQTVPTLNLKPTAGLIVPKGIYVTETIEPSSGRSWPSVTSCGYNPTFGETDLTVESYLLPRLTGQSPTVIEVHFRHFLRSEKKYPDASTLKAQILKDVHRSEAYWRHVQNLGKTVPSIY